MHGLARTHRSMSPLVRPLEESGYAVVNVGYPSRRHSIEDLAPLAVGSGLEQCPSDAAVHFVTHSLGGILLRKYLAERQIANLGRVVMLAPPNQGSEVVDFYRHVPGFRALNGPAGMQLGTDPQSVPRRLPPVDFELGVVAGSRSVNLILSRFLPSPDDGKVSVESTKVDGMSDHVTVAHSHPLIMRSTRVQQLVISFLATGRFES